MRWAAAPIIAVALLSSARAFDSPPVDEEFLEYLGSLEDGDDNWTVVAGDKAPAQPAKDAKPVPTAQQSTPQQSTARSTSTSTSPPATAKKPEPKT
jgi:hypothetical protein